jgi:Spy/CpxP family protein refolding chaperone
MNWLLSVLFLGILIVGNSSSALGQDPRSASPDGGQQDKGPAIKPFSSLISEVFAPIADKLDLTEEQQVQIMAIIIETQLRAGPLLQSLAVLDQQLSELTFSEVLNENRLKEISDREAAILSEIIQMKIRAKARIYGLLTTEQRAIVAQRFQMKAQREENLGSITIY